MGWLENWIKRFYKAVGNPMLLKQPTVDSASYSLTTYGATEENNWVRNVDTSLLFAYTTGHERKPENMAQSLACLFNGILTVSQKVINDWTNNGIDSSDTPLPHYQGNDGVVERKSMLGLNYFKHVFGPTLNLKRGSTLHIFAHFDDFYHGYVAGAHPDLDVFPLLKRHAAIIKSLHKNLDEAYPKNFFLSYIRDK